MDSRTIVERYGAKLEGQQLLWTDDDYVLRHTPFKDINRDFNREALVHWWMNVHKGDSWDDPDGKTPFEIWQTWDAPLWSHFNFVKKAGTWHPEVNQVCIQLSAYKDQPLKDHMAELAMWLPHVKPVKHYRKGKIGEYETKGKHIDVFEHTLSQHGCYDLWIFAEDDIDLCFTYSEPKNFKSIENAVDYVRLHHYYEEELKK